MRHLFLTLRPWIVFRPGIFFRPGNSPRPWISLKRGILRFLDAAHFAPIACFALLAGCETTAISGAATPAATQSSGEQDPDGFVLTRIGDPTLPKGRCGMVLWTLEETRPTAVLRYVVEEGGNIAVNSGAVDLTRVGASGAEAFGVTETQRFSDASGIFSVTVSTRFGLEFSSGVYLERGLVTVESADGWRSVTPVAGIAGCRGL